VHALCSSLLCLHAGAVCALRVVAARWAYKMADSQAVEAALLGSLDLPALLEWLSESAPVRCGAPCAAAVR